MGEVTYTNIPFEVEDGDNWILVFRQDMSEFVDDLNIEDYDKQKWMELENDENQKQYCDLKNLENYRRTDNTFWFKIVWPPLKSDDDFRDTVSENHYIEWTQTSNPIEQYGVNTPVGGVVDFIEKDRHSDLDNKISVWGGLEYNTSDGSLLDGSAQGTLWWYAIGTKIWWGGGYIPGPYMDGQDNFKKRKVELYVRVGPQITVETEIPTKTNSLEFTFNSDADGIIYITYDNNTLLESSIIKGSNTINLSDYFTFEEDTEYSNVQLYIKDINGYTSDTLTLSEFTYNTTPPLLEQVTRIDTYTTNTTPTYTFKSDKDGTFELHSNNILPTFSSDTSVNASENTDITFDTLSDGTYNLSIVVTDEYGNEGYLTIPEFTVDTVAPTITESIAIPTKVNTITPSYTFSSTEDGTVNVTGATTVTSLDITSGDNTITFVDYEHGNVINDGDIEIYVIDYAGNKSDTLSLTGFTIDIVDPVITQVTTISTILTDTSFDYTFNSSEAGSYQLLINNELDQSGTNVAGDNTITLNLSDGDDFAEGDIQLLVTDDSGNESSIDLPEFRIDITSPVIEQVTPIPNKVNTTTPSYTFSSTEDGTLTISGATVNAMSDNISVTSGNNTITLDTFNEGEVVSGIEIYVTDEAGHQSNTLSLTDFTIDTTAPQISETTQIDLITEIANPTYEFTSSEAGTLTIDSTINATVNGSSSGITVIEGVNTITFDDMSHGTKVNLGDLTLIVTDEAGNESNTLNVNTFSIVLEGSGNYYVTSDKDNQPQEEIEEKSNMIFYLLSGLICLLFLGGGFYLYKKKKDKSEELLMDPSKQMDPSLLTDV